MTDASTRLRREPHPISGALYEALGDGLVRVTDEARGKTGLFRYDGGWVEGELTYADPQLLLYVGGPDLPPGRDIFWGFLPPVDEAATGDAIEGDVGRVGNVEVPKIIAPYVGDPGLETAEGIRSAAHVPLEYLLDNDRRADRIPPVYRKSAPLPGGPEQVSVERFFSPAFHTLEVEHLWKKVWQMICREDDIPDVGDYHLYEIASLQYLVVRVGVDEIRAFPNACLHRGRQLRECHGRRATEFRCPFHGWSWNIDGSLRHLVAEWDFPGVRNQVSQLPLAKVARWGGFIFLNPDPEAMSFEDYAGPEMLEHYAKAKLANRYKQADVVKILPANWKIAQEAFLEGWHTLTTHPQVLLAAGDAGDVRVDVFGHWGRLGHAGPPGASAHRGIILSKEQALEGWRAMADYNLTYLRGLIGDEVDDYSDVELNEQSFNHLFPNFSPWGGWGRIVYRFRPHGDDPEQCLMQVMLLAPWPEGKPKPPPVKQRLLGISDSWTLAPEIGTLAKIFDQDANNIRQIQLGMKTKQPPTVWYSGYQEAVIRNFHRLYDKYLGLVDRPRGEGAST